MTNLPRRPLRSEARAGDLQRVAGDEARVLRGGFLRELHVEVVGLLLTHEGDFGFLGVEGETAGGLDALATVRSGVHTMRPGLATSPPT